MDKLQEEVKKQIAGGEVKGQIAGAYGIPAVDTSEIRAKHEPTGTLHQALLVPTARMP